MQKISRQRPPVKDADTDYLDYFIQGLLQLELFFCNGNQGVNWNSDPNLNLDRVFRSAPEGFNF
jgi:hypothetical protein